MGSYRNSIFVSLTDRSSQMLQGINLFFGGANILRSRGNNITTMLEVECQNVEIGV
jgi:hypothetical protein